MKNVPKYGIVPQLFSCETVNRYLVAVMEYMKEGKANRAL